METDNFTNTIFALGYVAENTSYSAVFAKKVGAKTISGLAAGCGCTTIDNNPTYVGATYKTSEIPPELLEEGYSEMPQEKFITVTFEDKSTETLKITATIRR